MSLFDFNSILEEYQNEMDFSEMGYPLEEGGDIVLSEAFNEEYIPVMESVYVMNAEMLKYDTVTENAAKSFWEKVKKFFKAIWDKIKAFFQWIKNLFKKKGKEVPEKAKEMVNTSEEVKKLLMAPKDANASSNNKNAEAAANKAKKYADDNLASEKDKSKPGLYADIYAVPENREKYVADNCKIVKSVKSGIVLDGKINKYHLPQLFKKDSSIESVISLLSTTITGVTNILRNPERYAGYSDNQIKGMLINELGSMKTLYKAFGVEQGEPITSEIFDKLIFGNSLNDDKTIPKDEFISMTYTAYSTGEKNIWGYVDASKKMEKMLDTAIKNASESDNSSNAEILRIQNKCIEYAKECTKIMNNLLAYYAKVVDSTVTVYGGAMAELTPILAFV